MQWQRVVLRLCKESEKSTKPAIIYHTCLDASAVHTAAGTFA